MCQLRKNRFIQQNKKTMRRLITTIFIFSAFLLHAQYQAPQIFKNQDAIIVEASNVYGKIYTHTFKAKETVYSLAKTFGQKPNDLAKVNPGVNLSSVSVGQQINIPFESTVMVKNPAALVRGKEYVNVYYEVQPKEGLYRIAKVYFAQSVETLMEINRLSSPDLKVGQKILVGWLPVDGEILNGEQSDYAPYTQVNSEPVAANENKPTIQPTVTTPQTTTQTTSKPRVSEENDSKEKSNILGKLKKTFGIKDKKSRDKDIKDVVTLSEELDEEENMVAPGNSANNGTTSTNKVDEEPSFDGVIKEDGIEGSPFSEPSTETTPIVYQQQKGIAIWNQSSTDSNNMFALHATAKVGTMIEITNPMMGKTIQAKVIGNIPPKTYTDDVAIVVSPKVAEMLGAMDRRFTVKLKYQQ